MPTQLPLFNLDLEQFSQDLDTLLTDNLARITTLVENKNKTHSWHSLMQPLEDMEDSLERLWSPFAHLHAVVNSEALRATYQASIAKLSAYEAAIGHNEALYTAINTINLNTLDDVQKKILSDTKRDFQLSGVALSSEKKEHYEALQARLAELSNQFENHLLDAVQAYSVHITDEKKLSGLPDHALHTAKTLAEQQGLSGWVLTLEFPCYHAIATYAEDRELRETLYYAYVTRASDQGPHAGQFDNTEIINELLALRHEKAQLLGFDNYAELSLATKMAESTHEVMNFLLDLLARAHPGAVEEFKQFQQIVQSHYAVDELKPWDIAYYAEKVRQQFYSLSQEDLRAYFPEQRVLSGLFIIIEKLYNVRFKQLNNASVWHSDVLCYQLTDKQEQARGIIYLDLYARPHKRGGAWMDTLQSRRILPDNTKQLPIATLTCNFAKTKNHAALSHDEVLTLFHEFGHCLHHLLTQVDYMSASGVHGVEWDAVELPSQIFENWCWEKEALDLISAHVDTGESLPDSLYQKLIASKNFHSALAMMRQLEFSLFDFRIHLDYSPEKNFVSTIHQEVQQQTKITPGMSYNRFPHSFSHIFAGGYCAGYYSYKWAEVLSSDAYARFEEEGLFNPKTGEDFLTSILEVGGSKKAAEAFINFRGRPATIDAFLRHNGLTN